MKAKRKNILYTTEFDGAVFSYHASSFYKPLLACFALNRNISVPANIIINYKHRRLFFLFTVVTLTVNRYKFGQQKLHPVKLRPILFVGMAKWIVTGLLERVDQNISKAADGRNIGLLHLDKDEFAGFGEPKGGKHRMTVNKSFLVQHFQSGRPKTGLRQKSLSI